MSSLNRENLLRKLNRSLPTHSCEHILDAYPFSILMEAMEIVERWLED